MADTASCFFTVFWLRGICLDCRDLPDLSAIRTWDLENLERRFRVIGAILPRRSLSSRQPSLQQRVFFCFFCGGCSRSVPSIWSSELWRQVFWPHDLFFTFHVSGLSTHSLLSFKNKDCGHSNVWQKKKKVGGAADYGVYHCYLTLYMSSQWPWLRKVHRKFTESKRIVLSATTTAVFPFQTPEIKKIKKDTDVFPQQPLPAHREQHYHRNENQTSLF